VGLRRCLRRDDWCRVVSGGGRCDRFEPLGEEESIGSIEDFGFPVAFDFWVVMNGNGQPRSKVL